MPSTQATDPVVEEIFDVLATAIPEIRMELPRGRSMEDGTNPSGETQLAADVFTDQLLENRIGAIDGVGEFASEERTKVVDVGEGLSVAIDPLDGSKNLKPNNTIGTIVAVYDEPLPATGDDLVAAGYTLYGPITTMIEAYGGQVNEFLVEDGERKMIREDIKLAEEPSIYSFGGRVPKWHDDFTEYVRKIELTPGMKLRYGGSMIGDVNQILTYGGIYAYPAMDGWPDGKLRLQFEGYPVAYILETAGGASSDGEQGILDVDSAQLHQRVPVYVGNDALVDDLEQSIERYPGRVQSVDDSSGEETDSPAEESAATDDA